MAWHLPPENFRVVLSDGTTKTFPGQAPERFYFFLFFVSLLTRCFRKNFKKSADSVPGKRKEPGIKAILIKSKRYTGGMQAEMPEKTGKSAAYHTKRRRRFLQGMPSAPGSFSGRRSLRRQTSSAPLPVRGEYFRPSLTGRPKGTGRPARPSYAFFPPAWRRGAPGLGRFAHQKSR